MKKILLTLLTVLSLGVYQNSFGLYNINLNHQNRQNRGRRRLPQRRVQRQHDFGLRDNIELQQFEQCKDAIVAEIGNQQPNLEAMANSLTVFAQLLPNVFPDNKEQMINDQIELMGSNLFSFVTTAAEGQTIMSNDLFGEQVIAENDFYENRLGYALDLLEDLGLHVDSNNQIKKTLYQNIEAKITGSQEFDRNSAFYGLASGLSSQINQSIQQIQQHSQQLVELNNLMDQQKREFNNNQNTWLQQVNNINNRALVEKNNRAMEINRMNNDLQNIQVLMQKFGQEFQNFQGQANNDLMNNNRNINNNDINNARDQFSDSSSSSSSED